MNGLPRKRPAAWVALEQYCAALDVFTRITTGVFPALWLEGASALLAQNDAEDGAL